MIVAFPNFCIDFASGLFGGCSMMPLRFTGFVQYFLNIPSQSHCIRERCREAASMALSAMDRYCLLDNASGCASDATKNGLELANLVGIMSSGFEVVIEALRVGVEIWTR